MTQIGNVYAQALYGLAKDEGLANLLLEELKVLDKSFQLEPDFLRLLSAPNLPKDERCRILDDSFRDKVHPYVMNYMKLLTEKGYMRHFSDVCKAFRDFYNQDHGILEVQAVTAIPLSVDQERKLTGKLSTITGKTVELVNRVDPDCLGGIRLDYDGKRVDGTVKNRLDAIGAMLKNTVL